MHIYNMLDFAKMAIANHLTKRPTRVTTADMPSLVFALGGFILFFQSATSISTYHTSESSFLARSLLNFQIFLSYKEASSAFSAVQRTANHVKANICETTPGVKSYSGYVHIPPNPDEG